MLILVSICLHESSEIDSTLLAKDTAQLERYGHIISTYLITIYVYLCDFSFMCLGEEMSIKQSFAQEAIRLLCPMNSHVSYGFNLVDTDKIELQSMLRTNSGSKDKIKQLRKWILDRCHSLPVICDCIHQYVQEMRSTSNSFTAILHTIYVINDVLYNSANATMLGVYLKGLSDMPDIMNSFQRINVFKYLYIYLGSILHTAYLCATDDGDRLKVARMVDLWVSKEFIDQQEKSLLENQMMGAIPIRPVPPPVNAVYPENLINKCLNEIRSRTMQSSGSYDTVAQPARVRTSRWGIGPTSNHIDPPKPTISSHLQPPSYPVPLVSPPQVAGATIMHPMPPPPPPMEQQPPPFPFSYLPPPYPMHQPGLPQFPPPYQVPPALPVPMAVPQPPSSVPKIDLSKTSVGIMANITKASLASGHPKYVPINPNTMFTTAAKPMEPGRLMVRVDEFYKKLRKI